MLNKAWADMNNSYKKDKSIIPDKYMNTADISTIMNVVLQGENNSSNKELFEIGMKIYNDNNQKSETKK